MKTIRYILVKVEEDIDHEIDYLKREANFLQREGKFERAKATLELAGHFEDVNKMLLDEFHEKGQKEYMKSRMVV